MGEPDRAPLTTERQIEALQRVSGAIAESSDLPSLMATALEEVCDLLGLHSGWVYLLAEDTEEPTLLTSQRLPPVSASEPERWAGLCWCIESLIEQNPEGAANVGVLRCSRLFAVNRENPEQLTHHASIPLYAAGRRMGIMNVARHDWQRLSEEELSLLTTIGSQLGMAVDRLRLLDETAERATRDERERLARDLHDGVLQRLTGIALQLEAADIQLDGDRDTARAAVTRALEMARESVVEARAAIADLGAPALQRHRLTEAVRQLGEEFEREHGIAVELEVEALDRRPAPAIEHGLYSVVQEGLHNVVKHSDATSVSVRLRDRGGERISLIVEDDGRGFDRARASSSPHGYGLYSMRKRVQLMGGHFRLRTAPGEGTRVEVSVGYEGTS